MMYQSIAQGFVRISLSPYQRKVKTEILIIAVERPMLHPQCPISPSLIFL